MSNYYKQKIMDENQIQYKTLKALGIMCFVLAAIMLLLGDYIPALVIIITGVAAIYFRKYLLVSFEYEIQGENVSVDKIIADKKRKNLFSFNLKDIIIMAPETSKKIKDMEIHPAKTLKLYPKTYLKGIYTLMINCDENVIKVKMVPDKKFVEICQKFNKQKVIKE